MNRFIYKSVALLLSVVMFFSGALFYIPAIATGPPELEFTILEGEEFLDVHYPLVPSGEYKLLVEDQSYVQLPGGIVFNLEGLILHQLHTTTHLQASAQVYEIVVVRDLPSNGIITPELVVGRIELTVDPNTPPTFNGIGLVVEEGELNVAFDWRDHVTDAETPDDLQLVDLPQASVGSIDAIGDGLFYYTHDGSEPDGTAYISFSVTDGVTEVSSGFRVRVIPVNDPPTFNDLGLQTDENVAIPSFDPLFEVEDPDSDLELGGYSQPDNGTVLFDGDDWSYTPDVNYSGTDTFLVEIIEEVTTIIDEEPVVTTVSHWRTVHVDVIDAENSMPLAPDLFITVPEGGTGSPDLSGKNFNLDPGETLTFVSVTQGVHGYSSVEGNEIIYQHDGSDTSGDTFTYTISDGTYTATGNVIVRIAPVPDGALVANEDFVEMLDNQGSVLIDITDNDVIENTLSSITVGSGLVDPQNGSVSIESGQIRYTPNPGFMGMDIFEYSIMDNAGQ